MALSGTLYTNVGAHWRLSISWSASQSISNNSSTVTAKMYWEALDGYGRVNSTAHASGTITIDGSSYSFGGNGLAGLSANQKKLLATKSKTIKHNSDGKKSFSISGVFNLPDVYLGGKKYTKVSIASKSYTLNTIPRLSTMTSSPSFTAGTNRNISISRQSSSFGHRLHIDVKGSDGNWKNIKIINFSTSETSKSTSFSVSEYREIFYRLNQRSSMDVRWNLHTLSGGNSIGYNTYSGKVSRPSLSTVSSTNGQASGTNNFYIDQEMSVGISRSNSAFTHTISIECGSFKKTLTGVSTSFKWTPTASEQASLAAQMPNTSNRAGTIHVTTYYDGDQIVGSTDHSIKFYIRESNSKPDFSATGIYYMDTNPTTLAITADDQYLIQNYSTLRVEIPKEAMATPKNGATIDYYSVAVNGVTKKANYVSNEAIAIDFGTIASSDVTTITVKAVDSRGFSTSVSKSIKMVPYSTPVVTTTAKRTNGFEPDTTLTLKGSVSPLSVNGTNRNSVEIARYRYKQAEATSFGDWQAFSLSGFPSYTATNVPLTLDTTLTFEIEVEVSDMLTSTTKRLVVPAGRPIMFMDPDRKSVGFFDFPDGEYEVKINGRVIFGNTFWQTTNQGEGIGALHLNNSDITGLNGLFFNDVAQPNNGEGLLFLKTGKTSGSSNLDDYDEFSIRDSVVTFNTPGSKISFNNDFDMQNKSVDNAYRYTIGGPGGNRGIQFRNGTGWRIVEAPNNMSNNSGPLQIAVGTSRKLTISDAGNVYNTGNWFKGESGGITNFGSMGVARLISDQGGSLSVSSDAKGNRVQSVDIWTREITTTNGVASALITNTGDLGRQGSARKYKLNIKSVDDSIFERILYLDPKSWHDKRDMELRAEYMTKVHSGEDPNLAVMPSTKRAYGLIAEELLDAGLDMFVIYGPEDEQGNAEVEGIAYDRLWVFLIPLVRSHQTKVKQLEEEVQKLKEQLGGQQNEK
ncbi:putative tail protein [Bacillus phage vB_BspH_Mawwa]|nr:putative tail protein [Bacillus phage vB_BspH_Mawwa]